MIKKLRVGVALGFVVIGFVLGGIAPSSAWAIGVDLVGLGTYSLATGTPALTSRAGIPGGGLTLNFRLGSKVDFQLGGYYATQVVNNGADRTSTTARGMATLRLNLSRIFFINLGADYHYYITNALSVTGSDYGFVGGLGIRLPLSPSVSFLINPMYRYSGTSLTYGTSSTITPDEVFGLVGFSFGMRAK